MGERGEKEFHAVGWPYSVAGGQRTLVRRQIESDVGMSQGEHPYSHQGSARQMSLIEATLLD